METHAQWSVRALPDAHQGWSGPSGVYNKQVQWTMKQNTRDESNPDSITTCSLVGGGNKIGWAEEGKECPSSGWRGPWQPVAGMT